MSSGQKEHCFSLQVVRGPKGRAQIDSRSGRNPVPITKYVPHPNTDRIVGDRDSVGHTEYTVDGTGTFSFKDGEKIAKSNPRGHVTGHTREYEATTGQRLQPGAGKMITGHSYKKGVGMGFGSSTHNTGAGPHVNPDRYTRDGSREATATEQDMTRAAVKAWRRDGQPRKGWAYNPTTGRAEGPNANRNRFHYN